MGHFGWWVAVGALLSFAGCTEYTLRLAAPQLVLAEDAVRWPGVVVGISEVRTLTVGNTGRADLILEGVALTDANLVFEALDPDTLVVAPGEQVALEVVFAPPLPGPYTGTLDLTTNDVTQRRVRVPLEGAAIAPEIRVEPEAMVFGWVRPGVVATRTMRIEAGGSGRLEVTDLVYEDPRLDEAFGVALAEAPPFALEPGDEVVVAVTFRPLDARVYEGELDVVSNAVNPEAGVVRLVGNGDTDPNRNGTPLVEILTPRADTQVLPGQIIPLRAATFDEEDDPTLLVAELRVDGQAVGTATPSPDGQVAFEATVGFAGSSELEVAVTDPEGAMGFDSVVVDVLDPDELTSFVISGGADPNAPIGVDDDLRIEVDGLVVLDDVNTTVDNHAPVAFEATLGSEIRVVATDQQFCTASMVPLVLHASLGGQQPLSPDVCRSACPGTPCFDETFVGPWPSVFLDETYFIAIP